MNLPQCATSSRVVRIFDRCPTTHLDATPQPLYRHASRSKLAFTLYQTSTLKYAHST
ncbi:hypothetical protein BDZ89DRAFT_1063443 [Hymenopellis radicata]|nr:hypothetical protein BDZ89DRAFT_1063443 [Hymenopellis radicata]